MKLSIIFLISLLFVIASSHLEVEKQRFADYVKEYQKPYVSNPEVYEVKFYHFLNTLKRIERLSLMNPKATFAINKFSDMSPEEFRATRLQKKQTPKDLAPTCFTSQVSIPPSKIKAPDSWDWRDKGVVNPVKDQGQCGSCWAFSVIGNIESLYAIKGKTLTSFSEQLIVDCSKGCTEAYNQQVCNQGCNGGWPWTAMFDIMSWGGVETESDYPYTARDGSCNLDKSKVVAPIKNYTCLSGPKAASEDNMVNYLAANCPLSVALNADYLQEYTSGIIDPYFPSYECDPTQLDHAVLIVGYGQETSAIWGTTNFWIVRNSWGGDWGEQGYFRIVRGSGCCGINTAVLSAVM
jgi:cathepsin F